MPYFSLHYKLITSIYDPPTSSIQCSNFSSMINDKKDRWILINIPDIIYKPNKIKIPDQKFIITSNKIQWKIAVYLININLLNKFQKLLVFLIAQLLRFML